MKDKSNRWPRSAKITVWVLGILLFLAGIYIAVDICTFDPVALREVQTVY